MQQKISLYEELLTLEPESRLFFPLAEMYVAENMDDKAKDLLHRGIAAHPDHLEAKLLLLDILHRTGKTDEMLRTAAPLVQTLRGCSALWVALGEVDGGQGDDQAALFRILGHVLGGKPFSWAGVMAAGIEQVCGGGATSTEKSSDMKEMAAADVGSTLPAEVPGAGEDLDAEEIDLAELEEDVKTRTLADLLAYQNEYEQALLIYERLRDGATSPEDREGFQARVDEMRMKMEQEEPVVRNEEEHADERSVEDTKPAQPDGESQVVDTLAALADRLEQRGAQEK